MIKRTLAFERLGQADMQIGERPSRAHESGAATLHQGEQGCTLGERVTACSRGRSLDLAITQHATGNREMGQTTTTPLVGHTPPVAFYTEDQHRSPRKVSPVGFRVGGIAFSQSFLSHTDVRKLIMETQAKAVTSDRQWLAQRTQVP